MLKPSKVTNRLDKNRMEIKSKLDAEFRRFGLDRSELSSFEEFYNLIEKFHKLNETPFTICYTDPIHGDLLPINNDDNFARAINSAWPLLRLFVQKKRAKSCEELNGYGTTGKRKKFLSQYLLPSVVPKGRPHISISLPEDFRQVSSIIDVDVVPETCRRVRLVKSMGGLAESTGLLAVNDEVLEVNGIEVAGKTLDQVTDMMVANSSNLIITIRPANQSNVGFPRRGSVGHSSQMSHGSQHSNQSLPSDDDHYEEDEIRDHTVSMCQETPEKPSVSEDDGVVTL
ncbi:partitioning defective 6 homolog beta [Caerostris extrusa]|uniref:Partitioning defective 6 homolog beta n=1 Tax=Caerostris extrusa TaxID=172846 RepID=A0AAV4XAN5_CAEEX|nr:partitioning defective 6 homolog beta [Caerostris extrusa]